MYRAYRSFDELKYVGRSTPHKFELTPHSPLQGRGRMDEQRQPK